ncbi:hypothetical protein [Burkholderia diffusa]|uniref:hypothetical protein n=1 Tax=Burkholderia diffusa TaxID=488732 RepID=UPI002ABDE1DD|nr:hypothetical protein [Burkholderia diffusa]
MSSQSPALPPFPGEMRTLRLVLTEPVPPALFVCMAKIRDDVATQLKAKFDAGVDLSGDLGSTFAAHLSYCSGLGEQFYEAGPSADFSRIIYIYRTQNEDDARKLMEADPFYQAGVFHDPWYFEWHIHSPIYKSAMPPMPEQTIEFRVHETTPQTLVACLGDFNIELAMKNMDKRDQMSIFHVMHVFNRHAEGGLGTMGIDWAVGPAGPTKSLHILNVPNVEMAKMYNEMDAACRWGIMSNFDYFEWCIHYPVRKASPRHKAALRDAMSDAGIGVAEA